MSNLRKCSKCECEESGENPFPRTGTLCKKCDAARKAEWYRAKKSGQSKGCVDCGNPLPSKQHKYCTMCKEKHNISLAQRKAEQYANSNSNQNRNKDRLIQRARRTCEDCGVLLPIETVDTPRLRFCESCSEKRSRESSRLRAFDLYHRRKNGVPEPGKVLMDFICQDCGVSFQHPIGMRGPRVKMFCEACRAIHRTQTLENRKEKKREQDRLRMKEKRKAARNEEEKAYHRDYMRKCRQSKKEGKSS